MATQIFRFIWKNFFVVGHENPPVMRGGGGCCTQLQGKIPHSHMLDKWQAQYMSEACSGALSVRFPSKGTVHRKPSMAFHTRTQVLVNSLSCPHERTYLQGTSKGNFDDSLYS